MTGPGRIHIRAHGLRRWHRWGGLIALLFLLIAAISGSLLVYKKGLIRLLVTLDASLPANFTPYDMAPQLDRIARTIAEEKRDRIKAPNWEEPYWTLTGINGSVQLLAVDSLESYQNNRWLLECFSFLRQLHTELLSSLIGETVLLASGILGLFLCGTGLILWWPTRHGFRWRWVMPRPVRVSFLLHYHRHVGALTTLTVMLVILTGSVMLWQKLVRPILPPVAVSTLPKPIENPSTLAPSQLLSTALEAIPDGWPTHIRLKSTGGMEANFRFRLPGEWHANGRTSITIHTTTGEVSVSSRSDQAPPVRKLLNRLYPLHSGYGMTTLYTLLVVVSGVALAWLAVTGGLSYLKRFSFKVFREPSIGSEISKIDSYYRVTHGSETRVNRDRESSAR